MVQMSGTSARLSSGRDPRLDAEPPVRKDTRIDDRRVPQLQPSRELGESRRIRVSEDATVAPVAHIVDSVPMLRNYTP